jgi:CHASE2 domain-containing sensor protein
VIRNLKIKFNKRALLGGGLTALLGVIALFELGNWLGNASIDLLFPFKATVATKEAVIIYMDDESHRELKQPWFQPWDRSLHAALIEKLAALGAKAVVFDILFDSPNTNNLAGDRDLVRAAAAYGRTFVAGKADPIVINGEIIGWKPTPPFDELKAVTTWGLVEASAPDAPARKHFRSSDRVPPLSWQVARSITNRMIEPESDRWMNFYGPPGSISWLSYHEVFKTNTLSASLVSNKVVFVGALFSVGFTGGKGTDDFRTPYSYWTARKSPGVEINATAFLNLLRGDWLRRASPQSELSLVVLVGAMLGLAVGQLHPAFAAATGAGVAVFVFGAALFLASNSYVWFNWLAIAAVQVPCSILWSLLLYMQKQRREVVPATSLPVPSPAQCVQFTVASRSAVAPGSSFVINIWAHSEEQRDEVRRRSAGDQGDTEMIPFEREPGVPISVRLSIFGLNVLNQEETIYWKGTVAKASFLIAVPRDFEHGLQTGLASIYIQGLKVSSLQFPLNIASYEISAPSLTGEVKRPRKAFACYATADRSEVLARVQGMQKACGDLEVFLDVHSLRSGQDWENEVRKAILACDIFYLFWSENARKSREVEREWRFALREKGRDFIDPVPLVSPTVVKPPEELANKHFNDWTLVFAAQKQPDHAAASNKTGQPQNRV